MQPRNYCKKENRLCDWPCVLITNTTICEDTPQLSLQSLGFRPYLALQGTWIPTLPIIFLQTPANCPLSFQISIGLSSKPRAPIQDPCPCFIDGNLRKGLRKPENEGSGGLQKMGGHTCPSGRGSQGQGSQVPCTIQTRHWPMGSDPAIFPESQRRGSSSSRSPCYCTPTGSEETEENLRMGSGSQTSPSV